MRKLLLLLSLLQLPNIISGAFDKEDKDTADSSYDTLPLTLIYTLTSCIAPTQINHLAWVNDGRNLGGLTQFRNNRYSTSPQIFLCGAESTTSLSDDQTYSSIPHHAINKYCNFPVAFNEQDILRCATTPKYMIEKILILTPNGEQDIPCQDSDPDARMYQFYYDLCITEDPIPNEGAIDFEQKMKTLKSRRKFEAFRFCYNSDKQLVLHTEHSIRSPLLLASDALKREQETSYQMMIDAGNYFNRDLLAQEQILDKFSDFADTPNMNEPASSDSPGPNKRYVLQKLVPPEHLAFSLWKKPTYDFLNLKLMRSDLVPLWDHINQLIRIDAIRKNREYYLQTGVYANPENAINSHGAVTETWTKAIYLVEDAPKAPYRRKKYKAISIMMNQFFDDETKSNPESGSCVNLCEGFFDVLFPHVGKSIRCCSIKGNISGPDRKKIDEDLELDFLRGTLLVE